MSGKVSEDRWVPDDPLVPEDHQGKTCSAVLEKVPGDQLICDDRQGGVCHTVSGRVPNDRWLPDDPFVFDDTLIRDNR